MSKPNVLIITSDQQHFDTLGVRNPKIKTPNLDRLCKEGTLFTRAYCPNPTCTPSRASIITGKYPSQHGAWSLGTKLPENEHTVGVDFTKAGYKTALIGKAHFQPLASTDEFSSLESYPILQDLDFWKDFSDPFYGFSHVELTRNHTTESHVGQHYALWLEEQGCENWRDYFYPPTGNMDKTIKYKWQIPEKYHYNNWIAQRTNALLEQCKTDNDNFFLWASFFDPHPAYYVPEPYDTMYDPDDVVLPEYNADEDSAATPMHRIALQQNPDIDDYKETGYYVHGLHSHFHNKEVLKKDTAVYYGMITFMDKYIGKILHKLDELGLSDNTIIVFTTDHGHFLGQHGLVTKGPYPYEDLIKVPFIVRYPNKVNAGETCAALQSLVDLAPTFLSLSGIDIPRSMTGVDQSKVWLGEKDSARDHVICENHHEPTMVHQKTYVDKRYKITVYLNQTYGELYDLQNDPDENNNLWDNSEFKDLKADLLLKYIWAELEKEPMWMPRISPA